MMKIKPIFKNFYYVRSFKFDTKNDTGHYLKLELETKRKINETTEKIQKINVIKSLFNYSKNDKYETKLEKCYMYDIFIESIYFDSEEEDFGSADDIVVHKIFLKNRFNCSIGSVLYFLDDNIGLLHDFLENLNNYIYENLQESKQKIENSKKTIKIKKIKKIKNQKSLKPPPAPLNKLPKTPNVTQIKENIKVKKLTYNDMPELTDPEYLKMVENFKMKTAEKTDSSSKNSSDEPESELVTELSNTEIAEETLDTIKVLMSHYDDTKFNSKTAKIISFQ